METSKDKAIDKITKLLNLANDEGATIGEVENAMKMANALMMKHQVTSENIELGFDSIGEDILDVEYEKVFSSDWRWTLLNAIARTNLCAVYGGVRYEKSASVTYKKTHFELKVIGSKENRKIVTTMYNLCVKKLPILCEARYKEYNKERVLEEFKQSGLKYTLTELRKMRLALTKSKFYNSYILGGIGGIREKMTKNVEELGDNERAKWGLIVVNNDALIEQHLKEKKIRTKKKRVIKIDNRTYMQGKDDAKHMNQEQLNA